MNKNNLDLTVRMRQLLHNCPELSGAETTTIKNISHFLKAYTQFEVISKDGWLLARRMIDPALPTIAFRADMDAIPGIDGPRHGCGHDGHSAILCGLALELEDLHPDKNLCLIFQPAEETGAGAKMIVDQWEGLPSIHRIYGLHNIPGYPKGTLLVRENCFACASCGMIVAIKGRPAHAAYPTDGANPAQALSRLVLELPDMIASILQGDHRLLMHTVVGLNLGGENFGLSASEGKLCLTLRGHRQSDIDALMDLIRTRTEALCAKQAMLCQFELRDVFPDTTNDTATVNAARNIWQSVNRSMQTLDEPMRWSEDFGWYLKQVPGIFFGIGTGEEHPGLHTADYTFDDSIIEPAVDAFVALAMGPN